MEYCLISKTINCKNCYKCIRHCPIKAISFKDNKAEIIQEECILCGKCHLVCPQNLKIIRDDTKIAKELIKKHDVIVSIAPSFVSYYHAGISKVKEALLKLGFKDVEETAVGATIVKKQYEKILDEGKQDILISSCCHSINLLIQKHYKDALKYLANVYSPMVSHGKDIKERNKDAKVVFIGPCIAKKNEGDRHQEYIDAVLTFEELDSLLKENGIEISQDNIVTNEIEESKARLFPTTGGILKTLSKRNDNYTYLAIDGVNESKAVLQDIIDGKIHHCFIEMSACHGSCVNGPIMKHGDSIITRDIEINHYAGKKDFIVKDTDINYDYQPIYHTNYATPSDKDIQEVLNSIGKTDKEHELNCGSCGYETCRKKAIAVLLKRATREMCLPYLMEKAQSFSNNIVNNSNVGYIVLDENLNIQLVNRKLCTIIGVDNPQYVIKRPVSTILDPVDFARALAGDILPLYQKEYLSSYDKYIEKSIHYDEKYHILIASIKDITIEEIAKQKQQESVQKTLKIADELIEKHMRAVQEIASLLGESAAETKVALLSLKETLDHDK